MKPYRWNEAKNKKLQKERSVSFEDIVESIAEGGLVDVLEHPNENKYRDQKIFVVWYRDYIYAVPFKETADEIRLMTIIPSRKLLKRYGGHDEK